MLYPAIKALGADTKKPALGGAGVLGPFASSVKVVEGSGHPENHYLDIIYWFWSTASKSLSAK
jgi:hypothetical protein